VCLFVCVGVFVWLCVCVVVCLGVCTERELSSCDEVQMMRFPTLQFSFVNPYHRWERKKYRRQRLALLMRIFSIWSLLFIPNACRWSIFCRCCCCCFGGNVSSGEYSCISHHSRKPVSYEEWLEHAGFVLIKDNLLSRLLFPSCYKWMQKLWVYEDTISNCPFH